MTELFDVGIELSVAGGPVKLYRGGNITGPPVLFLHGAMLDTAQGVWRRVAPELAAQYYVHVIDLPRHGDSRPWAGTLDDAFYRRFLDELLNILGLSKAALVGLSLGGGVALSYALEHPQRVSALIAVGPGGIGAKRKAQFATWLMLRTPGLLRLITWYLARFPQTIRKSMHSQLTAGSDTPDFEAIVEDATEEARAKHRHGERALDDWQVHAYGPFSMRVNYLPKLPRLTVPTLWIRGEHDPLVSHGELSAAATAAPGSHLVTVADAGHVVTYDQAQEFVELARQFLASTIDTSQP